MSHDHGPLRTFELTWRSGHIETVQGHQVMMDSWKRDSGLGSLFGATVTQTQTQREPRFHIHGQFGEHWRLVLSGPESELHTLRDVTDRERLAGGEPS